jgi:uncharacterized membrane protein
MSQEPISPDVTSDDKLWAMLGYIIPIIALVVLFMEDKKNRPFIKYHAVQSLALAVVLLVITSILGCILAAVTFFIAGVGGLLASALWLIMLWPAYESYNGKYLEIPGITNFIKNQGWV